MSWRSVRTFILRSKILPTHLPPPMGAERSEVAVVNDGPVDRQSRDRGAPQRAGRPNGLTERVPTLFFQTSVFKIRNAATLSVTAPVGKGQSSRRASQGRWRKAGAFSKRESQGRCRSTGR